MPTRADLARWLAHAAEARVPLQGASDHIVSEAIYLADPEGNGIEVYADRPVERWRTASGEVRVTTGRNLPTPSAQAESRSGITRAEPNPFSGSLLAGVSGLPYDGWPAAPSGFMSAIGGL